MTALVVVLAVLVGVLLGLLGGGGSILTVPLLAYVAGLPTREAIAVSLVVVGVTSLVATVSHARAGRVQWRTGLTFGAAGMVSAYAGGRLGQHVPDAVLMIAFALIMLAAGMAMLRGRAAGSETTHPMALGKAVGYGAAVGLLTGFLGAGGGFLIVPALALFGGLAMPVAVGTSLLVIAMTSAAGVAGHLSSTPMHWGLAAMVTAAAVLGSVAGGRLATRVRPEVLRRGFGWFVLAMAAYILVQEIPQDTWQPLAPLAKAAVSLTAALVVLALGLLGQRLGRRVDATEESRRVVAATGQGGAAERERRS
jgi:uncharacterized membrane protein YfcA